MLIMDNIELEYLNADREKAIGNSSVQDFISDNDDDMDNVLYNVDDDNINEFSLDTDSSN